MISCQLFISRFVLSFPFSFLRGIRSFLESQEKGRASKGGLRSLMEEVVLEESPFALLSEEVILVILSFIPPAHLAKCVGSVCKKFHRLVEDHHLRSSFFEGIRLDN